MPADDDADDDAASGPPLPRDDRLWRHPSEMTGEGPAPQQIVLLSKTSSVSRMLITALVAGLVGAGTTLAVVSATEVFVRDRPGQTSTETRDVTPPRLPGRTELLIAETVLPSVARVVATRSDGVVNATAVVFRSDGQLITTADAIDGAEQLTVYLNDGTKFEGADVKVVGRSVDADIAVIKIPRTDLVPAAGAKRHVTFGDQTVMIDASPPTRSPEITVGVVTKDSTKVERESKPAVYGLVQTLSRGGVTPRSPGTVFVDSAGTVMGLVTSRAEAPAAAKPAAKTVGPKDVSTDDGIALHFAVPADFVWGIAAQIVDNGKVVRPWVGLPEGADISREEANAEGIVGGMRVTLIEDASPARAANLRINDVIVAVSAPPAASNNGDPEPKRGNDNVQNYNDFVSAVRRHKPGEQITITYIRNGEINPSYVTLGGKPELP